MLQSRLAPKMCSLLSLRASNWSSMKVQKDPLQAWAQRILILKKRQVIRKARETDVVTMRERKIRRVRVLMTIEKCPARLAPCRALPPGLGR